MKASQNTLLSCVYYIRFRNENFGVFFIPQVASINACFIRFHVTTNIPVYRIHFVTIFQRQNQLTEACVLRILFFVRNSERTFIVSNFLWIDPI